MGKNLFCYNCGIPLDRKSNKREHIPAQCLFYGYSEEYKINIITVPCCQICNNKYSNIDQDIRDLVGIAKDEMTIEDNVTKKAVRSIIKSNKKWINRVYLDENGNASAVTFNYDAIRDINIKNFKGIFYHKVGERLSENLSVHVILPNYEKYSVHGKIICDLLLSDNEKWEISGHNTIFKYIIKGIANGNCNNLIKTENLAAPIGLAAILVYHSSFECIVLARNIDL